MVGAPIRQKGPNPAPPGRYFREWRPGTAICYTLGARE